MARPNGNAHPGGDNDPIAKTVIERYRHAIKRLNRPDPLPVDKAVRYLDMPMISELAPLSPQLRAAQLAAERHICRQPDLRVAENHWMR